MVNVSQCASKFCGWVLGVVEAARYHRGEYYKRTSIIPPPSTAADGKYSATAANNAATSSSSSVVSAVSAGSAEKLTFVQKLAKRKATRLEEKQKDPNGSFSRSNDLTRGGKYDDGSVNKLIAKRSKNVTKPSATISRSMDPYAPADSIAAPTLNPREEKAMVMNELLIIFVYVCIYTYVMIRQNKIYTSLVLSSTKHTYIYLLLVVYTQYTHV